MVRPDGTRVAIDGSDARVAVMALELIGRQIEDETVMLLGLGAPDMFRAANLIRRAIDEAK